MIIAIDGPAGSGKSTVAKMLAKHLGIRYLDTGAMYRALTWKAMQHKVNLDDERALCRLMDQTKIHFHYKEKGLLVFVDDKNVTHEIRSPSVTNNTHYISSKPGVRAVMVNLQREFALEGDTVAEGRDMGTVVFPDAEKKFFLDARIEERAKRRFYESESSNNENSFDGVLQEIELRDQRDTTRKESPLKISADSIYIDTTDLTINEVLHRIIKEVEPLMKNK
ncbi:MAG: (d)CMP kinase [Candidatus Kuenenia sp.]|nr:(d)CMP kinase [Candidatus Kuenenia hertensis]